jgi:hypothetical protein
MCYDKSSPTKDHGFGTSFTILLKHHPSQLEIAGLL